MKASVYIGTSLDGFIAGIDGDIDWLVKFQNQEVIDSYEQFLLRIDAIVIGRGSFEKVLSFPSWPYDKKVFVLSSSISVVPEIVKDKVTILSMPPKELLKYLSKEGFSRLYIDGGKVIQGFLLEDCIDEMIITRVPELIGKGIPLFGFLEDALPFRHMQTNIYSNGLVKSQYERERK
ncbi:MAG: dihydrofolate reductase family protein, partial [Chitinophagales bacterium]